MSELKAPHHPAGYISPELTNATLPPAGQLLDAAGPLASRLCGSDTAKDYRRSQVAQSLQAVVKVASQRQCTDGELSDALAQAVASCLVQTVSPPVALIGFITTLNRYYGQLATATAPKGSA